MARNRNRIEEKEQKIGHKRNLQIFFIFFYIENRFNFYGQVASISHQIHENKKSFQENRERNL